MKNESKKLKMMLSGNIKRYRHELGITQEQAAEKAGITVKYWQRLEMISQPDLPSLPMLNNIAKVLKTQMQNLLSDK